MRKTLIIAIACLLMGACQTTKSKPGTSLDKKNQLDSAKADFEKNVFNTEFPITDSLKK